MTFKLEIQPMSDSEDDWGPDWKAENKVEADAPDLPIEEERGDGRGPSTADCFIGEVKVWFSNPRTKRWTGIIEEKAKGPTNGRRVPCDQRSLMDVDALRPGSEVRFYTRWNDTKRQYEVSHLWGATRSSEASPSQKGEAEIARASCCFPSSVSSIDEGAGVHEDEERNDDVCDDDDGEGEIDGDNDDQGDGDDSDDDILSCSDITSPGVEVRNDDGDEDGFDEEACAAEIDRIQAAVDAEAEAEAKAHRATYGSPVGQAGVVAEADRATTGSLVDQPPVEAEAEAEADWATNGSPVGQAEPMAPTGSLGCVAGGGYLALQSETARAGPQEPAAPQGQVQGSADPIGQAVGHLGSSQARRSHSAAFPAGQADQEEQQRHRKRRKHRHIQRKQKASSTAPPSDSAVLLARLTENAENAENPAPAQPAPAAPNAEPLGQQAQWTGFWSSATQGPAPWANTAQGAAAWSSLAPGPGLGPGGPYPAYVQQPCSASQAWSSAQVMMGEAARFFHHAKAWADYWAALHHYGVDRNLGVSRSAEAQACGSGEPGGSSQ